MKWILMLVCGAGALPATALELPAWFGGDAPAAQSQPPRPVVSEIIDDRGADARSVPGFVASKTQVTLAFQTIGRMISRPVELGDRVKEGQLLAELATEDLTATTRAARAAVESSEVQMKTAQTTLDRVTALAARGVASDAQLEQAQQALAAAQAAASQAKSELARARDAEGFALMTAPFSGVISAVYEEQGAVVAAGGPVLQLSADDAREAVIDLPEATLAGIRGQDVFSVWQRSDADEIVEAKLDRIDPLADAATRTRRLHLSLPPEAPFRLGALIRARLGGAGDPALTVPTSAVFDKDGAPHVWRVQREADTAQVEAVAIEHGMSLSGRILVKTGIAAGDEIVVRGVNSLQPDQMVGERIAP